MPDSQENHHETSEAKHRAAAAAGEEKSSRQIGFAPPNPVVQQQADPEVLSGYHSGASEPIAQFSSTKVAMPGLGGNSGKRKSTAPSSSDSEESSDDDSSEEEQQPAKRQTRSASRVYDINRPTLSFSSSYQGVGTQKEAEAQDIYFHQNAVLSRPVGAPQSTAYYYDFRQQVRDEFSTRGATFGNQALTPFAQDGPYKPPYNNAVITNAPGAIDFSDDPGFSTVSKIPANDWLNSYRVDFRWIVKRKDGVGNTWTSPIVQHTADSVYNGGADAQVDTDSSDDAVWNVQL